LNDQASKFRLGCPLFQHKCRQRTRPRLLREVGAADRKTIGEDIKTVQIGWPLGMPLVRKMGKDMWEVRIHLHRRIARVLFTVIGDEMVLLHIFVKKSQETPQEDLDIAKDRLRQIRKG
jgi:phage-related protein